MTKSSKKTQVAKKTSATTTQATTRRTLTLDGHKNMHRAGSRKSEVHKIYDAKGRDAAIAFGEKKGLKTSTLKSWTGTWARMGKAPAKVAKTVAKATKKVAKVARKAAPVASLPKPNGGAEQVAAS